MRTESLNRGNAQLLTAAQVADLLQISTTQVGRLVDAGVIPSIQLGKKLLRFDRDDVFLALKSRQQGVQK